MAVGLTALGTHVPSKVLTNQDLESFLDTSDEWIVARTGIKERRISAPNEYAYDLAVAAVENLQERYGQDSLESVDLVIVGTNAPDAFFPSTAALIQNRFGLKAAAYDLLAGCPGWLYGLSQAYASVSAGLAKKALVIGTEVLTKITNWRDRSTAVLFGDGAGAAIVEPVTEGFGFKSFVMGADGSGAPLLHMRGIADSLPDGTRMNSSLFMNGREVYKFAVRIMNTATLEVLERAGLTTGEVGLFIPHQANLRIIEAVRERLKLPSEQVMVNVDRYGNTSTATIPIALNEALDTGRVHPGDHLLMISFGAGLTWAASVLTWGGGA